MECDTAAISLLKKQAGTVYDGRISQVQQQSSLIYRIQCARMVDRFGTAGPVVLGLEKGEDWRAFRPRSRSQWHPGTEA
ncbi:MAG: hypothetical protein DMG54_16985 [Acidobacteria bacterium]|nr:MAG: hypothetical protein DMG53_22670 [Acidobacteriota bacterium]PYU42226.1 MAG: hypothetical protein DMG54_16985 [Acidobacteriota bacterium]PYU71631.1 MAG: hypothetical protein DMG52_21670 [Acidobacteriota bacterium]